MYDLKEQEFLHFQNLVDQARKSIYTYCPEWTELNLSDPGITLIELFAYMTTQLNYRLTRVPARNYLKFLEIVGVTPHPPRPARTTLTFYLTIPFPLTRANGELDYSITTRIPVNTEVATRRPTGDEEEIIFITEQERKISAPKLLHVRQKNNEEDRAQQFDQNYLVQKQTRDRIVYEFDHNGFYPFQHNEPTVGNVFYLGFDENINISGYFLQLEIDCLGEGVGVIPDDPPLVWECSMGEGKKWERVEPVEDSTKGLTLNGQLTLHLPVEMKPQPEQAIEAYWVRCRLSQRDKSQTMYSESPKINDIRAFVGGITIPAIHSAPTPNVEVLGVSNGEPGQRFLLNHSPVLDLNQSRGEYLEVEEEQKDGQTRFVAWEQKVDFSRSRRDDRHFGLDHNKGEISFGPVVRQPDGSVKQYGKIPKLGQQIRITKYRTGGGTKGNVPINSLRVMKQPISYVVEVTNRHEARGGKDQESFERVMFRAREVLRRQLRAVTPDDYELFCRDLDYVARAKCLEPRYSAAATEPGQTEFAAEPGRVNLLVVPKPVETEATGTVPTISAEIPEKRQIAPELVEAYNFLKQLKVTSDLKDNIRRDLEPYRVLGITLEINQPTYWGVKIEAKIRPKPFCKFADVTDEVSQLLRGFITPLSLDSTGEENSNSDSEPKNNPLAHFLGSPPLKGVNGWPFGTPLYVSDVYARIRMVEDVAFVTGVKMSYFELNLEAETLGKPIEHVADEDVVPVPDNGLLYLVRTQFEELE